jgi:hypothetical protein
MAGSRGWFSEGPIFSEAVYFADLVHSLKIQIVRHLGKAEFEGALASVKLP